jgi:hypothetical protein
MGRLQTSTLQADGEAEAGTAGEQTGQGIADRNSSNPMNGERNGKVSLPQKTKKNIQREESFPMPEKTQAYPVDGLW